MKLLITGANGFIGAALIHRLSESVGHQVVAASRRGASSFETLTTRRIDSFFSAKDCRAAVDGMEVVIHAAGCAHGLGRAPQLTASHQRVNSEGTLNLAFQAAQAGVRRFIFISTVKVNGESTAPGRPFRSDDIPAPVDPYAVSKRDAEDGLRAIAAETGMECVIVRPPLVYGPSVKANFLRLMRWVDRGVPLPFSGVDNRRSLVYLGNLVDFLARCVEHSAAAGKVFMVSDGESLSTGELIRRLAREMGRPPRLFGLPRSMSGLLWRLPAAAGMRTRLFCSLEVDASPAREVLGWTPPYTVDEGLTETVRWYRDRGAGVPAASRTRDA